MTVPIQLSLKLLAEIIRYGLRNPGPDPDGSGTEAHQISPLRTTTSLGAERGFEGERLQDQVRIPLLQGRRSRSIER